MPHSNIEVPHLKLCFPDEAQPTYSHNMFGVLDLVFARVSTRIVCHENQFLVYSMCAIFRFSTEKKFIVKKCPKIWEFLDAYTTCGFRCVYIHIFELSFHGCDFHRKSIN